MPVALFVCPHCNEHAEVHVTTVTRSRPCPHCGEQVVLQVTGKEKGKRRALLVASGEAPTLPVKDRKVVGPAYDPLPLEGDPLERMKLDPEIKAFRRRLITGMLGVAAVIVMVILWQGLGSPGEKTAASIPPRPVATGETVDAGAPKPLPANAVGMRRGKQTGASAPTSSLAFEPPKNLSKADEPAPPAPNPALPVKDIPATQPAAAKGIVAQANEVSGSKKVTLAMTDPRVQAAAAVERFLTANNIDAMLSTIADRPKVEQKIRSYLETHPLVPYEYQSLTISNGAGPTGERSIVVTLKDGSTREAVVITEDGRSVVDWPSFVAWSDMEWAQFMQKKPSDPVLFRVIATPDQRFDNAFSDQKKLACIKLSDPRNQAATPIFAYVERKSIIGQELDFLMRQAEGKPTKLTLHLKYPAGAASQDQVLIDDILANGWMVPKDKSTASN